MTTTRRLRRGLPRVVGGDPWPPASAAPPAPAPDGAPAPPADADADADVAPVLAEVAVTAPSAPVTGPRATPERPLRRGLPRVPDGESWPPASAAPTPAKAPAPAIASQVAAAAPSEPVTGPQATPDAESIAPMTDAALRRGLPRVPGGEPWPPASASRAAAPETSAPAPAGPETAEPTAAAPEVAGEAASDAATRSHPPLDGAAPARDLSVPLPFTPTVWAGASATARPTPRPEPRRFGPFTALQWLAAVVIGGAGLIYAAGMLVVAVRWLVSTAPVQEFLVRYPGEYHLPEGAPVGIPAWLAWQHFFNVFLMVLIIRTGLRVRTEKRPDAFWSPRGAKKRKTSLNIWFHQSLDVLWVVNGIVFVVLLFATGQWMRIVPTSWEVFPNLLSAGLQYVSLDWPTENGWVNYNSLQQLAYFSTVFIAAPLAIITGIRMSMWWPKNAPRLNKAYPVEWARKLHFPVMLYFVVFIIIHVALVFATGALRNLNHMYAAQGSVDPDAYATNWTGFWLFTLSMAVIAAAWVAARPMVLAPIARLFGTVSSR
ncbi:hypothetical protein A8L33_02100 [Microbacterium aurantiacum]|uniref:Cytochrome b561 bacterial/Ni-hydrogenase domain-containing protein n=1 Tax=Microbacterium aurantiacum TaxID=162393 RepID=A0A0M8MQE3_9MICO|nr:cytochrome b/b6 domain-containing protein [Microbacterium chocolatum]ANG84336.1 hypothetical protein A8L33_02100 [Microbacterium chocolatum]KOS11730.1 hypothetical protein XI38_04105 [Microbacterium chocolatum]